MLVGGWQRAEPPRARGAPQGHSGHRAGQEPVVGAAGAGEGNALRRHLARKGKAGGKEKVNAGCPQPLPSPFISGAASMRGLAY